MDGRLLVFHLPAGSPVDVHRRFRKRVYGEATSAQGGKYEYRRKGLLDEIPHVLLYTGVVIVRESDERQLLREMREYGAEVERRWVRLEPSDVRALKLQPG